MADETDGALALANHYLELGNDRAALAALDRTGDAALAEPEYWLIRASALRGLDRFADAADAARRGLELEPDEIALLDSLALAELGRDRYVKAEQALVAALELEPDHALLHAHLALTLAQAKRYAEARAEAARAVALDPESTSALRTRAQVALLAEDPPETVRTYVADLLERSPNDQTGHAVLGVLSARAKNFRQSARELEEAARIDPTNAGVTAGAREARVYAHPVLAPVRPIWKLGRWRAYFIFIALSITLAAAHQTTLRAVIAVVWLTIVALSWFGPPLLRRLQRRKLGG